MAQASEESTETPLAIARAGFRLLGRYVRRQPLVFVVSLIGATMYAGAIVGSTIVLGRVTNSVIVPTFETGRVDTSTIVWSGVALLIVGLLRAVSVMFRRFMAAVLSWRTQRDWRRMLVDTYLEVPLAHHRERSTGEMLAHADSDIVAATEVINPFPFSIGVLAMTVFAIISLSFVDWQLTIIAVLLFPGLAVINRLYTVRASVPLGIVQQRVGDVSSIVHESFDGELAVKTMGLERSESERLAAAADELRAARIGLGRIRGRFEPMIEALPNLGIIVLLVIGSWQVSIGRLNTGQVVQAAALFGLLAFPMRIFGFFLQELPRAAVVGRRLDTVVAAERQSRGGALRIADLPTGGLSAAFEDVTFAYGDDPPVLRGVSLEIPAGSVVALVGATGSGKSTLCELLPRLVDPDSGVVRLGGIDLRDLDPATVRSQVALVFQETFLFADSIRENVVLDADIDDQTLHRAATIANAAGFVERLPNGWDTVIGERGVTLSGGQRQRLALTRALLREPRMLVLDDATSAVDPVVEAAILDRLRTSTEVSMLIVAHRISTIELADSVAFLDGGRIAATGTHAELLATVPAYAHLVQAYSEAADRPGGGGVA